MKRTVSDDFNHQMRSSNDPQGMYILGPDGKNYGFTNDHYPDDIEKFINSCLAKYKSDPPAKVKLSDEDLSSSFSIEPPKSATVVRVFARIWPLPKQCWGLNRGAGRDYLWIYRDEIEKLASNKYVTGNQIKLPESLLKRIVRFHLLDDVRGTPDMWRKSELKVAEFSANVYDKPDNSRFITFTGKFKMVTSSGSRGYEGTIKGEISLDKLKFTINRFRAFADGKAWGRGTYTPFPPEGKYGLHIGLKEALDDVARVVPPEAVSTANNDREYRDPSIEGGGDRGK